MSATSRRWRRSQSRARPRDKGSYPMASTILYNVRRTLLNQQVIFADAVGCLRVANDLLEIVLVLTLVDVLTCCQVRRDLIGDDQVHRIPVWGALLGEG